MWLGFPLLSRQKRSFNLNHGFRGFRPSPCWTRLVVMQLGGGPCPMFSITSEGREGLPEPTKCEAPQGLAHMLRADNP